MIDRAHALPLVAQAQQLGISRGSIYYLPRAMPDADLAIMRRIDELHLLYPFAGKHSEPVLIRQGRLYRRQTRIRQFGNTTWLFGAAALVGGAIGGATVVATPQSLASAEAFVRPIAASAGLVRARAPQEGDHWSRCDEARAAGSAPLYVGESGYREGLDGDSDGIACEPYPGMP